MPGDEVVDDYPRTCSNCGDGMDRGYVVCESEVVR